MSWCILFLWFGHVLKISVGTISTCWSRNLPFLDFLTWFSKKLPNHYHCQLFFANFSLWPKNISPEKVSWPFSAGCFFIAPKTSNSQSFPNQPICNFFYLEWLELKCPKANPQYYWKYVRLHAFHIFVAFGTLVRP